MAKLVIDIEEHLKEVIQSYADEHKMTLKEVTMKALGILIKELNKK